MVTKADREELNIFFWILNAVGAVRFKEC